MRSSAVGPDRAVDRSSAPPSRSCQPLYLPRGYGRDRLWPQPDTEAGQARCLFWVQTVVINLADAMIPLLESWGDDEGFRSRGGSPADDTVTGHALMIRSDAAAIRVSGGRCVRRCAGTARAEVRWRHRRQSDRRGRVRSSVGDAQASYLWLSQPGPIEPAAGT